MIDGYLDEIDERLGVLTEGRRLKLNLQLQRVPMVAKAMRALPPASDTMEAFNNIQDRLNELIALMNSGDITPGDMDQLYRVFGFLRSEARTWAHREMAMEAKGEFGYQGSKLQIAVDAIKKSGMACPSKLTRLAMRAAEGRLSYDKLVELDAVLSVCAGRAKATGEEPRKTSLDLENKIGDARQQVAVILRSKEGMNEGSCGGKKRKRLRKRKMGSGEEMSEACASKKKRLKKRLKPVMGEACGKPHGKKKTKKRLKPRT